MEQDTLQDTQDPAVAVVDIDADENGIDAELVRIYEVGYHIAPTVEEENIDQVVAGIRSEIENRGGSLITEGAPQAITLSYPMYVNKGGSYEEYTRAYFGWIKFEAAGESAVALRVYMDANENILRSLTFKTVREETRASVKPASLREVRRTDTITSTPRKGAERKEEGELSEEALDKSIEELIGGGKEREGKEIQKEASEVPEASEQLEGEDAK